MKILFATTNSAKIKKYSSKLEELGLQVLTLKDIDTKLKVEENGKNAIENAYIKAKSYYEETGIITIGIDDTLFIKELPEDKQPGTNVRRVNGKELTDDEMIEYYTNLVKENGDKLTAKWVYGMVIYDGKEPKQYTWSKDNFYFVATPSEKRTPGYPLSSISVVPENNKYYVDLTPEEKNNNKNNENDVIEFIAKCLVKQIPEFFKEMLLKQYGEELTNKIVEGYLKQRLVTLRVNTIKAQKENIKQILQNAGIENEDISWYKEGLIIKNVREEEIKKLDIYENGEIYLQSLSSMLPPIVLEPKKSENILDMAAAPGGKTTQIAAITENKAYITACEKNKIRAERLKYNLQKQGVGCVNVMLEDARKLSDFFSFDKILLDAPCSGSGTMSIFDKNFSQELINRSSKIQEELLIKALKILKPGGEIIYSTCSILAEENENVLKRVLKKSNAEIVPIEPIEGVPILPTSIDGVMGVCPNEFYEGFFVSKIKKKIR